MSDDLDWARLPEPGDPAMVEWLEGASCSPRVKALAVQAVDAASKGVAADRWRAEVLAGHPEAETLLAEAEECMGAAGLWLWPKS